MPPLIFVPGHMCGPWLYAPQMALWPDAALADTAQDDTVAGMAERVLASAPQHFAIAGLSMGGMVAMEVMARAPERVLGACLMDTDPNAAREREVDWRAGLLADGVDHYIGTFVERFYLHDPTVAARLGPMTREKMAITREPVIRAQVNALDTRREMAPLISGYRGAVEIIVGAEDRVCPPKVHAPLLEALPNAVLTEIPGCGHIATLEAPQAVNERLDAWLTRI
jgi:pimeloyl-ACP methyl ester carboxylesterase